MKTIYLIIICSVVNAQLVHGQQAQPNPTEPTTPILPILLQTGGFPGSGVTLYSDYFCSDINPANLGFTPGNKMVITFGFLQPSVSFSTDAVNLTTLKTDFSGDSITPENAQALATAFADHGFALSTSVRHLGVSVQLPKIGGFAFTWQDDVTLSFKLNPIFADIFFNGYHSTYFDTIITDVYGNEFGLSHNPQTISELFNGTFLKFSYTRTYRLSYGRELLKFNDNSSLYVGGGIRLIEGYALADGSVDANGVTAFVSYSPTFKTLGDSNSSVSPAGIFIKGPTPAGTGVSFDLGGTFTLNQNVRFGASLTDFGPGKMTWNGIVYSVSNTLLDTLKNYNGVKSLFNGGNGGSFVYSQPETYQVQLPTKLHLGGSIFVGTSLVFAGDVVIPLNSAPGNIATPIYTVSGGYCPTRFFRVSFGFQKAPFTSITMPVGILFGTGKNAFYQTGIDYQDILGTFKSSSFTLGFTTFFLRFRI